MNVLARGWYRIFSLRNLCCLPLIFLVFACSERDRVGYTIRDDSDYGTNQIIMFARISTEAIDSMLDS